MLGPRVGRLLPFIASQLDEPISDPSIISAYLLFLHAREEAGALLTAQGFGGDPPERAFGRGAVPATDRLAAEAALEVRMPFLDESLAPWRLTEAHLREALDGRLPRHVLKPVRRSPASSVDDWLRCEWRALAQDILLDPATQQRGWTDGEETRRLLNEHIAGRARHGRRLYRLLLLELWARAMIGREQAEPAPADLGDCARELPSDRAVRKVAVIAPAGIGDTVRLTPALTQMAASDPCLSLTLYVDAGRGSDEVMAGLAPADRHVPIEFHGGALAKVRALVGDIRRNTPDELVSAWVSRLAGLTGLLSGVKRRRGWVPRWSWAMRLGGLAWPKAEPYDPPRKDAGAYDMRAFARLLGIPSLETLAPRFASPIWEDRGLKSARRRIASLERPILAVSAAAAPAVRQREYPLDLMAKALRAVLGDGTAGSVVLLGDAPSRPRLEPLAKATAPHSLNLCGEVRISGAAALIRQCDAALVVDGGLLHVALCSDLPVVALYGPTLIFSSDPRDALGRYEVVSAFDRCRCRCRPHRGILAREECHGQAECLAAVAPEEVACAIASALRSCTVSAARGNG
jgi:ADP-heptose:LPS heptosyltransferase